MDLVAKPLWPLVFHAFFRAAVKLGFEGCVEHTGTCRAQIVDTHRGGHIKTHGHFSAQSAPKTGIPVMEDTICETHGETISSTRRVIGLQPILLCLEAVKTRLHHDRPEGKGNIPIRLFRPFINRP